MVLACRAARHRVNVSVAGDLLERAVRQEQGREFIRGDRLVGSPRASSRSTGCSLATILCARMLASSSTSSMPAAVRERRDAPPRGQENGSRAGRDHTSCCCSIHRAARRTPDRPAFPRHAGSSPRCGCRLNCPLAGVIAKTDGVAFSLREMERHGLIGGGQTRAAIEGDSAGVDVHDLRAGIGVRRCARVKPGILSALRDRSERRRRRLMSPVARCNRRSACADCQSAARPARTP